MVVDDLLKWLLLGLLCFPPANADRVGEPAVACGFTRQTKLE